MKSTTASLSLALCAISPLATQAYAPNAAIAIAAKGMSLLKPIFKAEAELQAAALGAIGSIDRQVIVDEINENKTKNKALIYTYGLSPFSSEAVAILEGSGYRRIWGVGFHHV